MVLGFGESREQRQAQLEQDELRLKQLGYRQELKRELTTFTNYGVALSVVCVCSGLTSLFGVGLTTGGPVVMTWGWLIVAFFTMVVALAMAEICSAFPTSGGLYFWAARLVPPEHKAFASWMTGWFNLIGQFAVTAGIVFGLALMIGATASVGTDLTWGPTPPVIVGLHIGICITIGIANSLGSRVMSNLMWVSTWWQVIAPFVMIITILAKAPTHQTGTYVFTNFENQTGIDSQAWVVLIGLLMAQYTFTGYDSSAHVTEETRKAEVAGPIGIVTAIAVSALTGFVFIVGFLFAMQDYDKTIGTLTGLPITQIMYDSTGKTTTIVLMCVNMLACWFCALASLVANSRMIYAFSRDGAMPGSSWWHSIHPVVETPVNANWLAAFVAALLVLPYLGNVTAYTAVTSIATIGLYLSYGVPIVCKLLNPDRFHPGPFNLGRYSTLVGTVAVLWIVLITVLFVLPTINPVSAINMNYACVAVGAVIFGAGGGWVVSGRHWFKGPVVNLTEEEKHQVQLDEYDRENDVTEVPPPKSIEERHHGHHPELGESDIVHEKKFDV